VITLNSLTFRLIAGILTTCLIAIVVVGFVLTSIVSRAHERTLDERLRVVTDNLMAMANVNRNGSFSLIRPLTDSRFQRVYSGWYWQIEAIADDPDREEILRERLVGHGKDPHVLDVDVDGDGRIVVGKSRSLWDSILRLPSLPEKLGFLRTRIKGPDGQLLRVVTREISLPGVAVPFQIAVAADLTDTRREINSFNTTLIWSLSVMAFALVATLFLLVHLGLAPLMRIKRDLADVRSGRLERLSGGMPAEIAPLADELNKVLDHNRMIVERSRTQVGNLAHALKTPLSVLSNSSKGDEENLPGMVREQTGVMREQVERYLARARTAASAEVLGARSPARPVLEGLVRTLSKINQERNIQVAMTCPDDLMFRGESADLEEVVGNLLDNAFKWAKGKVTVFAEPEGAMLVLTVCDDGPGLTEEQRVAMLERGVRLDETKPGSGLGLSIVGDIIDAYRGKFELNASPMGGLSAKAILPRALH
jgi:signal transduction histidine kinase